MVGCIPARLSKTLTTSTARKEADFWGISGYEQKMSLISEVTFVLAPFIIAIIAGNIGSDRGIMGP